MASLLLIRELFLLLTLCIIRSHGQLRFARYFADNMVLQAAPQRAIVWGYGAANALTTLSVNKKVYHTISASEPANQLGESLWSVTLDPESEEGPFEVIVTQPVPGGSLASISLRNVLYGDVWVCSGQSNMRQTLSDIIDGGVEIANAGNYPKIRLFTAALTTYGEPVEEPLFITQQWSVASPATVGGPSDSYFSAVCWLYGRRIQAALNGRPIGLLTTSWGGTPIETWMPPEPLKECGITSNEKFPIQSDNETSFQEAPNSEIYNGMIYPYTRMVITGVIWYQGESNANTNRDKYSCLFSKMIPSWRQVWHTRTGGITDINFPFGFVQLSTNDNTGTVVGGFPWIRWYQTFGVGYVPNAVVPNLFMAVALDLRDNDGGIHPRTKVDVGYRLSQAGLAVAYKQNVEYLGPIVSSVVLSSDSTTIEITYGNVTGIEFRNSAGFEVCCQNVLCFDDNQWVAAPATPKSSLSIIVAVPTSCRSRKLYGVRYLWRETPCPFKQAAVYSATDGNLPSPPYIKTF